MTFSALLGSCTFSTDLLARHHCANRFLELGYAVVVAVDAVVAVVVAVVVALTAVARVGGIEGAVGCVSGVSCVVAHSRPSVSGHLLTMTMRPRQKMETVVWLVAFGH